MKNLDEDNLWLATVAKRIKQGRVLPIISKSVSNDLVFGSHQEFLKIWADHVGFPFPTTYYSLSQIAQFGSVMRQLSPSSIADIVLIKEIFLEFLKAAMSSVVDEQLVKEIEDELDELSFSEMSARLRHPTFEDGRNNPLLLLADLSLPIYLTTSYDTLLETALERAGKVPFTEICYWHNGLRSIPSVFEQEPNYRPSEENPLVYHLFGLDQYPASLVLTEDDHLDFLAAISRDESAVALRVQQGLTDSSLLLLGYSLPTWEFRVLFSGIIKPRPNPLRQTNISIQLMPDEEERRYVQNYMAQADFAVFWEKVTSFLQKIWKKLEK